MSKRRWTRRDLLRSAAAAAGAGTLSAQQSAHVHQQVAQKRSAGPYKPRLFNAREYNTMKVLADLIVPGENGQPGGAGAGAPEFIDLLAANNQTLQAVFVGGLAWLDAASGKRCGKAFAEAPAAEQTALLDQIAYHKNDSPELGPGIRFFDWARRLVVDAFYTSPHGVRELEYKGNRGMNEFKVPAAAVEYAVSRSPFKE